MRKSTAFLLLFLLAQLTFSQSFTIRGFVSDRTNGERLLNANVYDQKILRGTVTNNFGFYSLTFPSGKYSIACSFVGYQSQIIEINLQKDTVIDFKLAVKADIAEIKVIGQRVESPLTSTQMSRVDIPMEKVQSLPAFLGEADVIKVIQLLPGVQSGSEGTSGLYVRGGGPDQNLILLDDVPVYNADHLFGFFSVFNPDAIKSVSFYKGGFPARYGGRLSSVLDIRMKDGNEKELHGNFSIGLISSKINLEGPLVKDKTTFNFSARRTYIDLLARPLITKSSDGQDVAGYFFHDLNMKITHKFSDRSRIYLSAYNGRDKAYARHDSKNTWNDQTMQNKENLSIGWGNITTALRWNYIFSNRLFANTTLTYSRYQFDVMEKTENKNLTTGKMGDLFGLNYKSGIEDFGVKMDFDYFPAPNHRIKYGGNIIDHTFRPGIMAYNETQAEANSASKIDTAFGNPNIRAQELSAYFEDNIDLTARLSVNVGLHSSGFLVDDTFYASLQPRISARWLVSDRLSLKAAYSKMSQNIHLLSSSTINLPTDLWLPTTKKVKPQNSHQFALGAVYQVNPAIDLSIEGFYKSMDHLLEYKDGASFVGATTGWEDKVEMGKGWSYGTEVLLQKNIGKTTGWIGYTWSIAERQFDNLNWGRKFYARYDRRHDVSFVMTHTFSKRFDVGLTWVYGTGNAVTLPTQNVNAAPIPFSSNSYYGYNGYQNTYEYYGQRNNYRMPSYHRMDVGFNFHKQKKHGIRTWNISFYNAYSRQNPYFLYFESTTPSEAQATGKSRKLNQVSLFPILPSFSYSYKF